jgi:hypothetical protein
MHQRFIAFKTAYDSVRREVIKSKRMRLERHVASMDGGNVSTGFCWLTLRENDYMEDRLIYKIILKWISSM